MSKISQLMSGAANTETPHTQCHCSSGLHKWILVKAAGVVSLGSKISILQSNPRKGPQFEGAAAAHNRQQGTLNQSSDLSEGSNSAETLWWQCSLCSFKREGDHVSVDSSGALTCVEVKNKTTMDSRDARQLGRNCQALLQGAFSKLAYKIPKGPQYNVLANQLWKVGHSLGAQVGIIRV
jgi:hypothetical protein